MPSYLVKQNGDKIVAPFEDVGLQTKHGKFKGTVEGIYCSSTPFVFLGTEAASVDEVDLDESEKPFQPGDYLLIRIKE